MSSSFNTAKPKVYCYNHTVNSNGSSSTTTPIGVNGGRFGVDSPVSSKRKKPAVLIDNMTNWFKSSYDSYGSACVPQVYRSPSQTTTYYGAMANHVSVDNYDNLGLPYINNDALLLNKAVAKVKGDAVNLANMLGEYRQTATLFGSLSRDLAEVTVAVLRKNPKLLLPRRQWTKSLAQRHLEYVYGIAPLVNDMHGVVKALRQRLADPKPIVMPVSVSIKVAPDTKKFVRTSSYDGISTVISRHMGYRIDTFKGYYKLKNAELLSGLGQYGMTNPLAVAYELMPFSFIVDWWCSLGDVLQSLDASLYTSGGPGVIITRQYYMTTHECNGGTSYSTYKSYNRRVTSCPTVARLAWKTNVSYQHIANGLALLRVGALSHFLPKKV